MQLEKNLVSHVFHGVVLQTTKRLVSNGKAWAKTPGARNEAMSVSFDKNMDVESVLRKLRMGSIDLLAFTGKVDLNTQSNCQFDQEYNRYTVNGGLDHGGEFVPLFNVRHRTTQKQVGNKMFPLHAFDVTRLGRVVFSMTYDNMGQFFININGNVLNPVNKTEILEHCDMILKGGFFPQKSTNGSEFKPEKQVRVDYALDLIEMQLSQHKLLIKKATQTMVMPKITGIV